MNINKENKKQLNITFGKGGSGSRSASMRLPVTWLDEIGVTAENRTVDVTFADGKIIIEKSK